MLKISIVNSSYFFDIIYLLDSLQQIFQLALVIHVDLHRALEDSVIAGDVDGAHVDVEFRRYGLQHMDEYAELVDSLQLDRLYERLHAVGVPCCGI